LVIWLAIVVELPLLIAFSATKLPGWVGTAAAAFPLVCLPFYLALERQNL